MMKALPLQDNSFRSPLVVYQYLRVDALPFIRIFVLCTGLTSASLRKSDLYKTEHVLMFSSLV